MLGAVNHMVRITLIVATIVGSLFASAASIAQTPPQQPALKTIGVSTSAKPVMVPSLIVINSRGAVLQGDKLTLTGVSPNAIVFADRPVRAARHALTTDLLDEWKSDDSFGKDPPNATVSALSKDASTNRDAVVVLKSPKLDGDKLTFDVQVLEGNLTGADGPTAVFIDIIGLPRTPLSFAGVARRTAFRGRQPLELRPQVQPPLRIITLMAIPRRPAATTLIRLATDAKHDNVSEWLS